MAFTNNGWSELISTTASDEITARVVIDYIRWENLAATGSDLVIQESSGTKKRTVKHETADRALEIPISDCWNGIKVATIDEGTVHVFLR